MMNPRTLKNLAVAAVLALGALAVSSPTPTPAPTMMPMSGMNMGMGSKMNMGSGMTGMRGMMGTAKTPAERAMVQAMMTGMNGSSTMGSAPMAWSGNPDLDYVTVALHHARVALALAKVELTYGKDAAVRTLAESTIDAQNAEIAKLQALLATIHR